MNQQVSVAIIGAGIAGLSCAQTLQEAGLKVTLFDKSRGPSGRMSTRRGDNWQCDHGAQYFTARNPLFRGEVARWQTAGVAAAWQPKLAVLGGLKDHQPDLGLERFVGTPRMTSPARLLAAGLDLKTEHTVTALIREPEFWQVETRENGRFPAHFDAILLAVPAPQAVPLLSAHSETMATKAGQALMRGSWALMLRYEQGPDLPFEAAFVNAGPLRWIARDSSKPGRDGEETWLLHASAEWSEAHIEEKPEVVAEILLAAFAELGGPAPSAWTAHRWRYADSASALTDEYCWDAKLRLGLCGDWLNGGKVEGAWLSGRALGQQLVCALVQP